MLIQIFRNTPPWVWAILGLLIVLGIQASRDRERPYRFLFILPLALLGLSVQSMVTQFGVHAAGAASWLCGAAIAAFAGARLFRPEQIAVDPQRGMIFQRGSWMPMLMMMGVFLTKYAVGVSLALHPAMLQQTSFVLGVCLVFGIFSGWFAGRLWRIAKLYRTEARRPAAVYLQRAGKA